MIVFQNEDPFSTPVSEKKQNVIVYDNSNIQKCCSGVTTPLTYNLTKRLYAMVYRQTVKSLSLTESVMKENEDVFQNLVGLIKGRIYYNINNWYRGLQLFHPFKQNTIRLAQMLGLNDRLNFAEQDVQSWRVRLTLIWMKYVSQPRLLLRFAALKRSVPKFLNDIQKFNAEFYKQNFQQSGIDDLKRSKAELDGNLLNSWTVPVVNDLYILQACAALTGKLKEAEIGGAEELVDNFLNEEQSVSSLQPARHMHRLAIICASQPELKLLISRLPNDIHQQVKVSFTDFYREVLHFIDHYGDRTTGELKLETQTMRTNPLVFYSYLRDCLNAQISEIRASSQSPRLCLKIFESRLSALPDAQKRTIFSTISKLQTAIAHREVFKLERSRVFGMYRALYLAFGSLFVRNGWIENADDIFYLTEEEILECENGKEYIYDTLVATRRQEFKSYEAESTPSRVFVSSKVIDAIINKENVLPVIQSFDSMEIKAEVA